MSRSHSTDRQAGRDFDCGKYKEPMGLSRRELQLRSFGAASSRFTPVSDNAHLRKNIAMLLAQAAFDVHHEAVMESKPAFADESAEMASLRRDDEFRLVIEAIPALAWCHAVEDSKVYTNQCWHDYAGLSAAELQRGE